MISAEYCDAVATYYAVDYADLIEYINTCEKNGIFVKFVDFAHNACITVERGIYGETYG